MPTNNKSENQYYGKYRECCVVAALNGTKVEYNENYIFSNEEKEKMYNDGKKIANFIGNYTAIYSGNHTATAAGDIILSNGENVEIKTVSAGTGTYFNTSIYYFLKWGFNFKDYMEKYGLYEAIDNGPWNIKANRKANSPISQTNSSFIRHNFLKNYENTVKLIDEKMREEFTKDIANYFINNTNKIYEFINDMISKNTETCQKGAPDRLIIYNYNTDKIKEINLSNFIKNINNNIQATQKGLIFGNIRVVFGWSNGNGLNNPTIRVFLEV